MDNKKLLEETKEQEKINDTINCIEKAVYLYENGFTLNHNIQDSELEIFLLSNNNLKSFELYEQMEEDTTPSHVDAMKIIFRICDRVRFSKRSNDEKDFELNKLRMYARCIAIDSQTDLREFNDVVEIDQKKAKVISKKKF